VGDRVVFTGDMDTSRTEIEAMATAEGLRVTGSDASRLLALVRSELRSSVVSVLKS